MICAAVPSVTRGLLDDMVLEGEVAGKSTQVQRLVLKVKRGAFGTTKVQSTLVTVTSTGKVYTIDQPLPRPTSLFDFYVLQPRRS